MDLGGFKNQFAIDDIPIILRTPNCSKYYDVRCCIKNINNKEGLVIDLVDNSDKGSDFDLDKENWAEHIEPKYKVGDVVTNCGGLHPNVKCTIAKVDIQNQCYFYKEVNGFTSFKEQDKLKLAKLDSCSYPVEDDVQLALDATIARQNVQIYNHNNYFQFKEIDYMIICASKNGFEYYEATFVESFHYTDKRGIEIKGSELVDRINRHYSALGFDVCVDKTKDVYKVLIQW